MVEAVTAHVVKGRIEAAYRAVRAEPLPNETTGRRIWRAGERAPRPDLTDLSFRDGLGAVSGLFFTEFRAPRPMKSPRSCQSRQKSFKFIQGYTIRPSCRGAAISPVVPEWRQPSRSGETSRPPVGGWRRLLG